jgi:hypothetical protein
LRNRSFAVEEFGDLHAEVTLTDDLLNRVSKAFLDSPIAHIQNGVLEKTKHLSLYRDDCLTTASLHADQFNEADVTSMFETARPVARLRLLVMPGSCAQVGPFSKSGPKRRPDDRSKDGQYGFCQTDSSGR